MRDTTWRSGRCLGLLLAGLWLGPTAWGRLPEGYTLQLQARTNLLGNASGAYNLEPGNLLAGSHQVPITKDGQVAFRLALTPEGPNALWWGRDGQGRRIYLLPELGEDARASDPGLNSRGDLAFAVTGASRTADNGLYLLNAQSPDEVRIVREPTGASNWESLKLNEAGQLGFRASFNFVGKGYVVLTPQEKGWAVTYLAREKSLDGESPYEYLYSPTMNGLGQMAGVGDLSPASGEWFQELRIFRLDGTSTLVAQTRGREPSSPFFRFASVAPALNDHGQVAFLAWDKQADGRTPVGVYLWDGKALRKLARNGEGDIKEVEFFPPDLNDDGLVVFRAIDSAGRRAVWVGDGEVLKRVVSEHDIVRSDLGPARIDQETPSNPVFGGSVSINADGDVSVVAGLAPPDDDQEEWGTAVFVAHAEYPPTEPDGGSDGGSGGEADAGPDGGPGEPSDGGGGSDGGSEGAPDSGVDGGSTGDSDGGADGGSTGEADGGADGGSTGEADGGADGGSTRPDSGAPGGPVPEVPGGDGDDSGCGCQSTSPAAAWPWLLLGLTWMGLRQRGRRSLR
ncbi:MYXO-CTERM sorting domain-containing protein [Myxococcus sp. K15C18031901]|uniref:MXAN_5453 family MXYO-CTERM-anchored protein n=1 Tax=Myxococcus dinghuensis TaxID=2906761 RepID=UPI0020A82C82|nr:MXAN_5453 family MXYO-CTERM-anchored protein [Myxococcus dinghuensis]MCP3105111.1 MYXO-CTERM sorting domain-containing protein [Myxococcus dinghuensis]